MRRNIILIIIATFLLIFGAVIYVFFFGGEKWLSPKDQQITVDPNIPPGQDQTLFKLSGVDRIISAVFSFDDKSVWYVTENGSLFRDGLDGGQTQALNLPRQLNVKAVFWSAGSDFILQYELPEGLRYVYYN